MTSIYLVMLCLVPGGDEAAENLTLPKLMQEVSALQTVYQLKLKPAQLKALRKLAETTAAMPGRLADEGKGNASDEVRKTLIELRTALIEQKKEERIDELTEQLENLRDAEAPEFDEDFELTESAVEQTPAALRLLTASQVADYSCLHSIILDPREMLKDAIDSVRGMAAIEWNEFRETTAEQVGALVGGLDEERMLRTNDQVVQWLIIIRSLSDKELKDQRDELEKRIDEIVLKVGPTDILRHYMEHTLAELLANPRLLTAIDLRLKAAAAAQAKPGD